MAGRPDSARAAQEIAALVAHRAAWACALLAIAYGLAQIAEWIGLLGSAGGPQASSTPLGIALLLTPSLMLGFAFVLLMAALHRLALVQRLVWSQGALAFATIYATLIGMVYFTQLTLVAPRMAAGDTAGIEPFLFVPYRSFLFAVDLLGYTVMSLSTLLAAFALPEGREWKAARGAMIANGLLAPFLAFQMFWPVLIWGGALWGLIFPAAMILVARQVRPRPFA